MLQEIILRYTENLATLRLYVEWIGNFISENLANKIALQEPHITQSLQHNIDFINSLPDERSAKFAITSLDMVKFVKENFNEKEKVLILDTEVNGKKFVMFALQESLSLESQRLGRSEELLYQGALISLTSMVEWFLEELIGYYKKQKTNYSDDEIEKEVNKILRPYRQPQFYEIRSLAERMRIRNLDPFTECEKKIVEVFLRRNCLVHNQGKVNKRYVEKLIDTKFNLGEKLTIDSNYLFEAIDMLEIGFILFAAELWKKLDKEDESRAETLLSIAFNHQLKKRWNISEQICQFIQADKFLPDWQPNGQLNYWFSVKQQGRYEEIREDVQKANFSNKDYMYQLSHFALKEDAPAFFQLASKIWNSSEGVYENIEKHPMFYEMRKFPEYEKLKPTTIDDKSEGLVN